MRSVFKSNQLVLSTIRVSLLVTLVLACVACQRTQRPFAGENEPPADAPNYSVKANPNGGVVPVDQ